MSHETFREVYARLRARRDELFGGESRQAKAARKRKNDAFVGGTPAGKAAALRRRAQITGSVDPMPAAQAAPAAPGRKRRGRPPGRRSAA